jgi:DNA ligase (NAD+)
MTQDQMGQKLIEADKAYYNDSSPTMTDEEYDDLRDEFSSLYPDDEYFDNVGAEPESTSEWKKAPHIIFMGSLAKIHSKEELFKFANDNSVDDFILEDKMDGLTAELIYENGKLVQAITRGRSDTNLGEDILINVRKMKNVKLNLPFSGSLKGEIYITRQDFQKVNEILRSKSMKGLKNPRNGTSGTAKRYDGQFSEYLSILYYDVLTDDVDFSTEAEKLQYIQDNLQLKICNAKQCNKEQAIELFNLYEEKLRAELNYDIDGLVVRINDLKVQEKLGITGAIPNGQKAWKFKALMVKTNILSIELNVSGGGRVNPVAILKPVDAGGVTISRATLHNFSRIRKLNLGENDEVIISRRNDVIPFLEKVEKHVGKTFEFPKLCPICESQLFNKESDTDEKFLYCENMTCESRRLGSLKRWIGAVEIEDMGPRTIQSLYDSGMVNEPADFYKLTLDNFTCLDRIGERTGTKILKRLHDKMEITIPDFICGLNVSNVSKATAKTLVEAGFDTIEKIQSASTTELVKVKGIEIRTAEQIVSGLAKKKTVIENLFNVGIKIKEIEKVEVKSNIFAGKSVCFTGGISRCDETGKRFTRDMMQKLVIENGGTISAVKSGLSFLCQVDPNSVSSKSQKAKELKVTIISEDNFFKMLGM